MGTIGVDLISAIAIIALVSMANAGVLASSRYPFAMARQRFGAIAFARVSPRSTPTLSILVTGVRTPPTDRVCAAAGTGQACVGLPADRVLAGESVGDRVPEEPSRLVQAHIPLAPLPVDPTDRHSRRPDPPDPDGVRSGDRICHSSLQAGCSGTEASVVPGQPGKRLARCAAYPGHRPAGSLTATRSRPPGASPCPRGRAGGHETKRLREMLQIAADLTRTGGQSTSAASTGVALGLLLRNRLGLSRLRPSPRRRA